jgi:hypothetical protein
MVGLLAVALAVFGLQPTQAKATTSGGRIGHVWLNLVDPQYVTYTQGSQYMGFLTSFNNAVGRWSGGQLLTQDWARRTRWSGRT